MLKYLTQFSIIVFIILFYFTLFCVCICVKYFLAFCRIIICNLWWNLFYFTQSNLYFLLFSLFQVQMENKLKAVIYCDIKVSWWFIGAWVFFFLCWNYDYTHYIIILIRLVENFCLKNKNVKNERRILLWHRLSLLKDKKKTTRQHTDISIDNINPMERLCIQKKYANSF